MSNIFAVGGVRSGSVKRVAAAVDKGSQAVATLHAWLAQKQEQNAERVSARA